MKQGLADAVGDMHSVIAAEFGDVRFVDRVRCVGGRQLSHQISHTRCFVMHGWWTAQDVKFTDVSPGPDWSSMFGAQALASAGQAIAAMAASGGGPGAMTAGATSETGACAVWRRHVHVLRCN